MSVNNDSSSVHWSAYIMGALTIAAVVTGALIVLKSYEVLPKAFDTKNIAIMADALGKETAISLLFLTTVFGTTGTYKLAKLNKKELEDEKGPVGLKPDLGNRIYILSGTIDADPTDEERARFRNRIAGLYQQQLKMGEYVILCHAIQHNVPSRKVGGNPRLKTSEHYYLITPAHYYELGTGRQRSEKILENHPEKTNWRRQVSQEQLLKQCSDEDREQINRWVIEEGNKPSVGRSIRLGVEDAYNGLKLLVNRNFS